MELLYKTKTKALTEQKIKTSKQNKKTQNFCTFKTKTEQKTNK